MNDTDNPRRFAVVTGGELGTVERYMPSNYTAKKVGGRVLIAGRDSAGWTLVGYVIPRLLSSGMIAAREINASEYRGYVERAFDASTGKVSVE